MSITASNDTSSNTPVIDKTFAFVAWALMAIPVPFLNIIAVIMSYIDRSRDNPILKTHYTYLIRTFFISLLIFALAFILAIVGIGVIIGLVGLVWYYVRVVKGLMRLSRNEAIENPTSWGF